MGGEGREEQFNDGRGVEGSQGVVFLFLIAPALLSYSIKTESSRTSNITWTKLLRISSDRDD